MSETTDQSAGGTPTELPSGNQGKDSVAYETYRKTVSEVKNYKEETKKLRETIALYEAQVKEAEQSVLAEQGKFKELNEKLREELARKDQEFKAKEGRFVKSTLKNTVAKYAKDMGAIDEAVDQIYSVGDWASVEFKDDDYSVNADQVKKLVGEMAQKNPWFFKKSVSAPRDVVIGGNQPSGDTIKDLTKLTTEQLLQLAKQAK